VVGEIPVGDVTVIDDQQWPALNGPSHQPLDIDNCPVLVFEEKMLSLSLANLALQVA
jgi:hypothetical protein